jgi:hypothetical protein
MSAGDATFFGDAAGLRGDAAARFVRAKLMESPVLSLSSQRKLFEEITTQETIADIRRLLNKPDVTARYGYVSWTELSPFAREVLFDLRYRGDYTPKTRESIQPFLVTKDDIGLRSLMNDTSFWTELGVPRARIQARAKISTNGEVLRKAS